LAVVWEHTQSKHAVRLVALAIAARSNRRDGNWTFAGIRTLARDAGLDVMTVNRAFEKLEKLGELQIENRGPRRRQQYRIVLPVDNVHTDGRSSTVDNVQTDSGAGSVGNLSASVDNVKPSVDIPSLHIERIEPVGTILNPVGLEPSATKEEEPPVTDDERRRALERERRAGEESAQQAAREYVQRHGRDR
jgi:DNA-binding transcriptional MocR family regulator